MKSLKYGSLIGRCTLCSHKIHDTDLWMNKSAIAMNGKNICGGCLKDMRLATGVALRAYNKMLGEAPKVLSDRTVTKSGLYVDEATGKIRREQKA